MIEVGGLTVIDFKTYTCIDIDNDGYAHLRCNYHPRQAKEDEGNTCSLF